MLCVTVTALVTMVMGATPVRGVLVRLEAEDSPGNHRLLSRGPHTTVNLQNGDSLAVSLCVVRHTRVTLEHVIYTNDGDSDVIHISLDASPLGSVKTRKLWDGGNAWDKTVQSERVGTEQLVKGGWHQLRLSVETDQYGVEVDGFLLEVDDPYLTSDIMACRLPCIPDPPLGSPKQISAGYAMQRSYVTQCAEEDNVHIAVFHHSVSSYTLTASLPHLHSFRNFRHENTSNCPFLPAEYWTYSNLSAKAPVLPTASAINHSLHMDGHKQAAIFSATFNLKGKSLGFIDATIGSVITLTLDPGRQNVEVMVKYRGKERLTPFPPKTVNKSVQTIKFDVPDLSWSETEPNEVTLEVKASNLSDVRVVKWQLQRRPMKPDREEKLYQDDSVMVDVVYFDFWWRTPENMRVIFDHSNVHRDNVGYLRVWVPVPWGQGGRAWGQVLVLYQDGNCRLLPPPPSGVDWVPFGTSVILGQTDPNDFRPSAPIREVKINPMTLTLLVTYYDGGTSTLTLRPQIMQTTLEVTKISFTGPSSKSPFASFRSMFVAMGNNDADSFRTDISSPHHVMGSWERMPGSHFRIYRACESTHLTQSPDLDLVIQHG